MKKSCDTCARAEGLEANTVFCTVSMERVNAWYTCCYWQQQRAEEPAEETPPGNCPYCNGQREWSGYPGRAICFFCGRVYPA